MNLKRNSKDIISRVGGAFLQLRKETIIAAAAVAFLIGLVWVIAVFGISQLHSPLSQGSTASGESEFFFEDFYNAWKVINDRADEIALTVGGTQTRKYAELADQFEQWKAQTRAFDFINDERDFVNWRGTQTDISPFVEFACKADTRYTADDIASMRQEALDANRSYYLQCGYKALSDGAELRILLVIDPKTAASDSLKNKEIFVGDLVLLHGNIICESKYLRSGLNCGFGVRSISIGS